MNRREFFQRTAGVITLGWLVKPGTISAGNVPAGFPEMNWIQLPAPISAVTPYREHLYLFTADGIYRVDGCGGKTCVTDPEHARFWAEHIDQGHACVTLQWR